jgi:hypothetical protein
MMLRLLRHAWKFVPGSSFQNASRLAAFMVAVPCALLLSTTMAVSDDLDACCSGLEQRIEELNAVTKSRKMKLEISGQVHRALLFWDVTRERNVYGIDPSTTGSYFEFSGDADINDKLEAGFLLQIETVVNESSELSQSVSSVPGSLLTGAANIFFAHDELGTFTIGRQTEAHDYITEFDLSQTDHFAGPDVSDWNGGFFAAGQPGLRFNPEDVTWGGLCCALRYARRTAGAGVAQLG